MGFWDTFKPRCPVGSLSVAIGEGGDPTKVKTQLGETHRSSFDFFAHLCFVFEDAAFVLYREVGFPPVSAEGLELREHLRAVLADASEALWMLAAAAEEMPEEAWEKIRTGPESWFDVGTQIVPALGCPPSFAYVSHLYRRGEEYVFERTEPQGLGSWGRVSGPHIHNAVFALYDHLISKAKAECAHGSDRLMRVAAGVGILSAEYDRVGALSSSRWVKPEVLGFAPKLAIQSAAALDEASLRGIIGRIKRAPHEFPLDLGT